MTLGTLCLGPGKPPHPDLCRERSRSYIDNVTVTEGNTGTTPAVFTVTLTPASSQTVTVDYATADQSAQAGTDYTSTQGTLTFAPGETTKTITVPVLGDNALESNERFVVQLSNPTNATLATPQGIGEIVNDDSHFARCQMSRSRPPWMRVRRPLYRLTTALQLPTGVRSR